MSKISPDKLQELIDKKEEIDKELLVSTQIALQSQDVPTIQKAMDIYQVYESREKSRTGQKSYIINPNEYLEASGYGYREKQIKVSYGILRRISYTTPVQSIISTRIEQVASFAVPQRDIYSNGFVIRPKRELKEKTKQYTKQEQEKIDTLTEFIMNCGIVSSRYDGDSFDDFIRKITRDSLTFDQLNFEVVWNRYGWNNDRKGQPTRFLATDASLFRFIDDSKTRNIYDDNSLKYPAYVQLKDNAIWETFYKPELCFGIRNKSTDIYRNGYGRSELEDMIAEITSFLWASEYNRNYFKNGSMPKGMIKISGENISQTRLREFKTQWYSMMQGVQNAWKTPIVEADKFEFQDLTKSNTDMEFNKWLEFLVKLICAAYKIDPSEIGFNLGGGSETKVNFESNNEARLKYSKDKGLYPLLKFIQFQINKYIIEPLAPDFIFQFVGLDGITREQELDMKKQELDIYKTFNEIRQEFNLEPIKGGDIIGNAQFLQAWQMAQGGDEESNEAVEGDDEDNPFERALNTDLEKLFYQNP